MTEKTTYDPNLVLRIDEGYINQIIEMSEEMGDEPAADLTAAQMEAVTTQLGNRWSGNGLYERVADDIIEVVAEVLGTTS